MICAAPLFGAGELSGRRAPGFSLMDSTMRQRDLQDYRGKVLLIDVMQTNCPHCATLTGVLERVKAKYGDKVGILSIVNPPDNQQTVASYVSGHHVSTPIVFDCGQVVASYVKATPQNPSVSVPHLFLIDPRGTIRNDWGYDLLNRGIFEGDGLFAEIDRLLSGGAGAPERGKK